MIRGIAVDETEDPLRSISVLLHRRPCVSFCFPKPLPTWWACSPFSERCSL